MPSIRKKLLLLVCSTSGSVNIGFSKQTDIICRTRIPKLNGPGTNSWLPRYLAAIGIAIDTNCATIETVKIASVARGPAKESNPSNIARIPETQTQLVGTPERVFIR